MSTLSRSDYGASWRSTIAPGGLNLVLQMTTMPINFGYDMNVPSTSLYCTCCGVTFPDRSALQAHERDARRRRSIENSPAHDADLRTSPQTPEVENEKDEIEEGLNLYRFFFKQKTNDTGTFIDNKKMKCPFCSIKPMDRLDEVKHHYALHHAKLYGALTENTDETSDANENLNRKKILPKRRCSTVNDYNEGFNSDWSIDSDIHVIDNISNQAPEHKSKANNTQENTENLDDGEPKPKRKRRRKSSFKTNKKFKSDDKSSSDEDMQIVLKKIKKYNDKLTKYRILMEEIIKRRHNKEIPICKICRSKSSMSNRKRSKLINHVLEEKHALDKDDISVCVDCKLKINESRHKKVHNKTTINDNSLNFSQSNSSDESSDSSSSGTMVDDFNTIENGGLIEEPKTLNNETREPPEKEREETQDSTEFINTVSGNTKKQVKRGTKGKRKKVYQCDECELTFSDKNKLTMHLKYPCTYRSVLSKTNLTCPKCCLAFNSRSSFDNHRCDHSKVSKEGSNVIIKNDNAIIKNDNADKETELSLNVVAQYMDMVQKSNKSRENLSLNNGVPEQNVSENTIKTVGANTNAITENDSKNCLYKTTSKKYNSNVGFNTQFGADEMVKIKVPLHHENIETEQKPLFISLRSRFRFEDETQSSCADDDHIDFNIGANDSRDTRRDVINDAQNLDNVDDSSNDSQATFVIPPLDTNVEHTQTNTSNEPEEAPRVTAYNKSNATPSPNNEPSTNSSNESNNNSKSENLKPLLPNGHKRIVGDNQMNNTEMSKSVKKELPSAHARGQNNETDARLQEPVDVIDLCSDDEDASNNTNNIMPQRRRRLRRRRRQSMLEEFFVIS